MLAMLCTIRNSIICRSCEKCSHTHPVIINWCPVIQHGYPEVDSYLVKWYNDLLILWEKNNTNSVPSTSPTTQNPLISYSGFAYSDTISWPKKDVYTHLTRAGISVLLLFSRIQTGWTLQQALFFLLSSFLWASVIISTSGGADKLLQLEHCSQQLSPGKEICHFGKASVFCQLLTSYPRAKLKNQASQFVGLLCYRLI